jgi:pimeloyl-ACP methyl ester carboxylesterase
MAHDWGAIIAWYFAMRRIRPLERLVIMNVPHPGAFALHREDRPAFSLPVEGACRYPEFFFPQITKVVSRRYTSPSRPQRS